jgi:hypothetical protein
VGANSKTILFTLAMTWAVPRQVPIGIGHVRYMQAARNGVSREESGRVARPERFPRFDHCPSYVIRSHTLEALAKLAGAAKVE